MKPGTSPDPPTRGDQMVQSGIASRAGALSSHQRDGRTGEPLIEIAKMETFLREQAVREVEGAMERAEGWRDQALRANDALVSEFAGVANFMDDWKAQKKEMTELIRSMRMTVAREVAETLQPLRDLREFFLGADHDEQMTRLEEFVRLCKDLKNLKDSGFLDQIADTLLNLASGEHPRKSS